jgi:hypothetical protein
VADYVLGSYGSGAIMAVPGHDTRDLEFAQAFGLPVKQVVAAPAAAAAGGADAAAPGSSGSDSAPPVAFTAAGVAVNSGSSSSGLDLNGLATDAAKAAAIEWLEERGIGQRKVNFKLRDWLFARQRYWGEPFPIVYPEGSEVRRVLLKSGGVLGVQLAQGKCRVHAYVGASINEPLHVLQWEEYPVPGLLANTQPAASSPGLANSCPCCHPFLARRSRWQSVRRNCHWCFRPPRTSNPAAHPTRRWPSAASGWQQRTLRAGLREERPPPCLSGLAAAGTTCDT